MTTSPLAMAERHKKWLFDYLENAFDCAAPTSQMVDDILRQLAPEGWQPIENAKMDMTEVVGMDDFRNVHVTWYFAPSSRTFGWMRKGGKYWKPTKFVPMPVAAAPISTGGDKP